MSAEATENLDDIALDGFDSDIIERFEYIAELAGGTLSLTTDGQFVIYGVLDPESAVEYINEEGSGAEYMVKVLGPSRIGLSL